MKSGLIRALVAILVGTVAFFGFMACSGASSLPATHRLTIVNASSSPLSFVRWTDGEGATHLFAPDAVYDATLQRTVDGLLSGSRATESVGVGSDPIFFFLAGGGVQYRTQFAVTIGAEDSDLEFTITETTMIVAGTSP